MQLINYIINKKYFFFLFIILVSFFLLNQKEYFFINILEISFLFFLILLPFFFHNIYFRSNLLVIPYLHIYILFFFIFYCLGFFFNPKYVFFYNTYNKKLIDVLVLSIVSLYAGYFLLNFFLKNRTVKLNYFKLEYNNRHIILYISLIYLIFYFIFDLSYLSKYFIFFKNSFFYLLAVSLANYLVQKKNKTSKILFSLLFLILLLLDMSTSSIFISISVLSCFVFCIFFLKKKKLALIFVIFLIFFGYIFQVSKYNYRQLLISNNNFAYENALLYVKTVYKTFIYSSDQNKYDDVKKSTLKIYDISKFKRIFHSLAVLSVVVVQTPENVNFYYGKSYSGIVSKFVPRIIIPTKSEEVFGNFWGKRYGLLADSDNVTSWNFPVLAEFYANYGTKLCIIGMFFIGCFIRIISIPITNDNKNKQGNLISICIFYQFVFQEYNLTLVLGNLYISLFSILLILYITKKLSINNNY